MRLGDYLDAKNISPGGFARDAGVHRGTIAHVLRGGGCGVRAAVAIVEASGGLVTLEDLAGPEPVEKLEDEAQGDGMERA